jgi:adenylosuccinate synthase
MDKTGRNGLRVGDIELKILQIVTEHCDKHEEMIKFYDVSTNTIAEMETEFFAAIEELKKLDFIDSEEIFTPAQRLVNQYCARCSRFFIRC